MLCVSYGFTGISLCDFRKLFKIYPDKKYEKRQKVHRYWLSKTFFQNLDIGLKGDIRIRTEEI